ncbi:MAG: glycine cleavage system protein [Thermoleophilia bacterium]|nr:glycine cleavage system protein [Thermoleophilia bacterium]
MAESAVDTPLLRRTPLDEAHEQAGAKLVPFAGWRMPLQYEGIIAEHTAVRTSAGLFDVSHMGQLRVQGADAIAALQRVLSNDLARIPDVGQAQYSMLLNDAGGIEDDLIAYRIEADELLLVVNASNREHDAALLDGIAEDVSDGWAMLALQGPAALDVLAELTAVDVRGERPFHFVTAPVAHSVVIVATTGYTGERGCELLVPADGAVGLWNLLADDVRVTPCGLGSRDTLRLEACYPLHGNDIGPDRDPIGAGLAFAASRDVPGGGPAHEALRAIRDAGPRQKLVPVSVTGRGIPRAGTTVLVGDAAIGTVTSGTMSPVLRQGIALAWVDAEHAATGTELSLDIRGTRVDATVAQRPFVRGSLG